MAALQVYNTLTRRKEPFTPLKPGAVGMYLCGPTVYSDCHIGHLMGPVLFDAVARWLRARGYDVRFVNNITDIDDKIIAKAIATKQPWEAITERYSAQYFDLLKRLRVGTITDHPRCTQYVGQMVAYIGDLIAKDRAYVADDGVYYDVRRQQDYGKLSGRRLDEMTADVEKEGKAAAGLRHPADFALWKLAKPGEPSWPSPWGAGRPGWHIECSVMSLHTLGETFDIHAGGEELKFPHHENEIAQGEAHGGGYARCWMHNNLVQYEGAKVSKSDARMSDPAFAAQFQALNVVNTHGAAVVRLLLLSGHYRRPVDFSPQAIESVRTSLSRLHKLIGDVITEPGEPRLVELLARAVPAEAARHRDAFCAAMDDDFNTAAALAELHALAALARRVDGAEREQVLRLLRDLGRLIGIFMAGDERDTREGTDAPPALTRAMPLVLELRQRARAGRAFAVSDRIRAALAEAGIAVKDAKDGATWQLTGAADAALTRVVALLSELRDQARSSGDVEDAKRIADELAALGAQDSAAGAGVSAIRDEYVLQLDAAAFPAQTADSRAVEATDTDRLAQLMLDAFRGTIDDNGETLDDAYAEVARFLAGEYGAPLLAHSRLIVRDGQAIAAALATSWERRSGPLIAFVMTAAPAKRHGHGRAVLGDALAALRAAGHARAYAVITRGNLPSEGLFAAIGFARTVAPVPPVS